MQINKSEQSTNFETNLKYKIFIVKSKKLKQTINMTNAQKKTYAFIMGIKGKIVFPSSTHNMIF